MAGLKPSPEDQTFRTQNRGRYWKHSGGRYYRVHMMV